MIRRRLAIAEDFRVDSLREGFIERAKAADAGGVDTIFVTESTGHDAFVVLSEIARATSQAKLATRIASIWDRTPTALARAYKSLDIVSDGRAVMGIGAGDRNLTESAFGMSYAMPAKRLREYAHVLPDLVSGQPVVFEGEIVSVNLPAGLRFPPVQARVPLWIAASGPINMRTVAEKADGWLTYLLPFSRLSTAVRELDQLVSICGREPGSVAVQSSGVIVAERDNVEAAKARVRRIIAEWVIHGGFGLRDQLTRMGYEEAIDRILRENQQGRKAQDAVPEDIQQDMIFVGDLEACTERIDAEREAGASVHQVDVETDSLRYFEKSISRLVG